MPVKIIRKFTFVVNGKEYSDQKEAAAAAKEANHKEKQSIIARMIQQADNPLDAAEAIMAKFHVWHKKGKYLGGPKRKKAQLEWVDAETEDQLS